MPTCKISNVKGKYADALYVELGEADGAPPLLDETELTSFVTGQMAHNGGWMLTGGRAALEVFVSVNDDTQLMLLEVDDAYAPTTYKLRPLPIRDKEPEVDAAWCYAAHYFLEWAIPYWEQVKAEWLDEDCLDEAGVLARLQRHLLFEEVSPWGVIFVVNIGITGMDATTTMECDMHERQLAFMDSSLAYLTADRGPVALLEGERLVPANDWDHYPIPTNAQH